jgi:hypothetical protein
MPSEFPLTPSTPAALNFRPRPLAENLRGFLVRQPFEVTQDEH